MLEKQKKEKAIIRGVIPLIWFVLYFALLWKIPFYLHLNSIQLPSDSEVIVTKVGMTDEGAWWHVVAQNVFCVEFKDR